ncbi:hypothetical protein [Bradyrhizobium sp. AZCC 2262]|uniref:hypothetical protein n=1 Tax=Bradyrhizobium sp. AZCC 2262 TaxID=3117022 RepID=UPI002FF1B43B
MGKSKLLNLQERWPLPMARYFIFVGGTLAALLFIADWCLPTPPGMFTDQQLAIDRAIIRIKSARKWPEEVVLDTSQPTISSPAVEEPSTAHSVRLPADEAETQSNLEAMAQVKPVTQPAAVDRPTLQVKRRAARTAGSKRPHYSSVGKSGSGWRLLSVWMDR